MIFVKEAIVPIGILHQKNNVSLFHTISYRFYYELFLQAWLWLIMGAKGNLLDSALTKIS